MCVPVDMYNQTRFFTTGQEVYITINGTPYPAIIVSRAGENSFGVPMYKVAVNRHFNDNVFNRVWFQIYAQDPYLVNETIADLQANF